MKTALLFPGQGAQKVGMAADLLDHPMAQQACEAIGIDLVQIMREGPAEELQKTHICQPALFLHSALLLEVLKEKSKLPEADYFLGLSLGEITALYAAGVMEFADCLKALHVRGSEMQKACEHSEGSMASVFGLEDEKVEELCQDLAKGRILVAANFNCPGQVVISGEKEAISDSIDAFKEAGAKRVLPLKVAGAFHSPLMQSACTPFRSCLDQLHYHEGAEKVIGNRTAQALSSGDVANNLEQQIISPVRFTKSIQSLAQEKNIDQFIEIGTGKVLSGLVKRIAPEANISSISNLEDIENLS